ncbi:DUF4397 domain-containing protein [Bacillus sp. T33-2]|uniref:DUF4397 domain-containing protein n=1 Tax=Bacillus sp. T33-2 TaxID=2054168 RepID=UPI000C78E703|nr:DUF4397 domain-containing protein [Bacillus sp. T33-2]PLR98884.1 hypothetical protein CVD19_04445 [Bacillus sp. T33-2]
MPGNRNVQVYFQKASMYNLLADYYKYSNPQLHVLYYQKHLKNLYKAIHLVSPDFRNTEGMQQQPAEFRLFHASPDADKVDIYLNGSRIFKDFPYKKVSSYMTLAPGIYQIDIYPAGDMVTTIISTKVNVEPEKCYTSAVAGPVTKPRLSVFEDEPGVPVGESKARFIHLSYDAPACDVAVKNGDVIFPDAPYSKATNYLGLTPMTVDLEVRVAGTKNVALDLSQLKFRPNQGYTIVLVGTAQGEPELEAIILQG